MLTCSCESYDDEWYYPDNDFSRLETVRRKRCCSCRELIEIGADCVKFNRFRAPVSDVEERISGCEVPLAPWYLCEKCGEIYLNLDAIGYCYFLGDSIQENIAEYWELTGFSETKKMGGEN